MAALHEWIEGDREHTGLARLSMNLNYLQIEGYSPDLVRQSVSEEITILKGAGNFGTALQEAAWARVAGIEIEDALIKHDQAFLGKIGEQFRDYVAHNKWDRWARLRNSADVVWRDVDIGTKNKEGLLKYFERARWQAQSQDAWGAYATYAADVRELADRDLQLRQTPSAQSVQPPRPRPNVDAATPPGTVVERPTKVPRPVVGRPVWRDSETKEDEWDEILENVRLAAERKASQKRGKV
jgi:hypothetical protein